MMIFRPRGHKAAAGHHLLRLIVLALAVEMAPMAIYSQVQPPDTAATAAIQQLIARYAEAVDKADPDLAAQVWSTSPDISFIHPNGQEHGWEQVKAFYTNQMGAPFSERGLITRDIAIHVYGESAWAEFNWHFTAKLRSTGATVETDGRETQIYHREGRNGWRLVHVHYSAVPAQTGANLAGGVGAIGAGNGVGGVGGVVWGSRGPAATNPDGVRSPTNAKPRVEYRGLAEHGLPLVTPDNPAYSGLVRDIESRPQPFGHGPTGNLDTAAVLLNQSGKAIVALSYFWRYTTADGRTRTNSYSNLGSSAQLDVLSGRAGVVQDLGTFILAGSKRLITEKGMFGNNLDVLPQLTTAARGNWMGVGGGSTGGGGSVQEITGIELVLDAVILEDGVCVGPDQAGFCKGVADDLALERNTARQIVEALHGGASVGQVFEILRPLARRRPPAGGQVEPRAFRSPLRRIFANMAIRQLVDAPESEMLAWFERMAESVPRVHRVL